MDPIIIYATSKVDLIRGTKAVKLLIFKLLDLYESKYDIIFIEFGLD